jgi:hypothetical protein
MTTVTIKETQNPTILKFELKILSLKMKVTNSKNIDDAKSSPCTEIISPSLVKNGLYLRNFIAIEKI